MCHCELLVREFTKRMGQPLEFFVDVFPECKPKGIHIPPLLQVESPTSIEATNLTWLAGIYRQ